MKDGFVKVAAATPVIKVADVGFNTKSIIDCMEKAAENGAKVLVFPELCVTGYTCGDLFFQKTLLDAAERGVIEIAEATEGKDMLVFVGAPMRVNGVLYDCAVALCDGVICGVIPKTNVTGGEKRYFAPGPEEEDLLFGGEFVDFGTKIMFCHEGLQGFDVACEIGDDLWVPNPPSVSLAMNGASVIVNLSANEEGVTKNDLRRDLVSGQSRRLVCGYICAEAGEGESTQDSVFAGHSVIAENGHVLAENTADSGIIYTEIDVLKLAYERRRLGTFGGEDDALKVLWGDELTDTVLTREIGKMPFVPGSPNDRAKRCERAIYLQCLGLKKRVQHTRTKKLVVGVSGGLDSTLTMLVCARTLKMMGRPADDLIAITMPGFGTTNRTKSNAEKLSEALGAEFRTIPIGETTLSHFKDIGHDPEDHNVVYENAQARERTQVLMDIANGCGGLVIGTGDMSELALGWATFNGDHMSMYAVNSGVPKTMMRYLVGYIADTEPELTEVLRSILDTPVSPELLPAENGEISQKTEDIIGPYELHDFFLYYGIRWGFEPKKVFRVAKYAFEGDYDGETILKWLKVFYRRFFTQQFKRTCSPDGPRIGTLTLAPGSDWSMPTDAAAELWLRELEDVEL